jgi:hypothetical protein
MSGGKEGGFRMGANRLTDASGLAIQAAFSAPPIPGLLTSSPQMRHISPVPGTRLHTRVDAEAANIDLLSKIFPSAPSDEIFDNRFECDAVHGVLGLRVGPIFLQVLGPLRTESQFG